MSTNIYLRLCVMMFLQFFVWGSWFVTLSTHLSSIGFSGSEIGYAYLMNNVAAMASPFLVGMVADRFFSSQNVMGILHILGGVLLLVFADVQSTGLLITGLLLYNLSYMPTLALVNAVSFNQMSSPEKQFPKVRVWGTIGWIAASLVITFVLSSSFVDVEKSTVPLKMGAIASFLMGLYSFTLPNTPPRNTGKHLSIGDILGLKTIRLLKERNFAIFALCSLLISIPLAFYYNFTNLFLNDLNIPGAAAKQSMGQMSEIFFMLLMPFFFVRFGIKKMLLIGMLAWVVRYALFATGNPDSLVWMLYGGILLHGVCYDFFFVTGQIYVDYKAPSEVRASAQGFISLLTYGVGIGIGSILSGNIIDAFTIDGVRNWNLIWWIPCVFAGVISIFFALFFKNESIKKDLVPKQHASA